MLDTRNKEHYREQFENDAPVILWLPNENFSYRKYLQKFRTILTNLIHDAMTVIATRILSNELELSLPDKDILDEWSPEWWKNPPPELTSAQPATPHTRTTKGSTIPPRGKPTTHMAKMFILTCALPPKNHRGQGPDWLPTWCWTL